MNFQQMRNLILMEAELATINNIIDELVILIYKLLEDNEYLEYRLSNLEEDYL